MDELAQAALLVVAGATMGFVNNLAGAGGVIGLVAFDLVAGLPIGVANASLRPSATAIALSGAVGFLTKRRRIPARAWLFGLIALPGAVLGTQLAIRLPPWVYETVLLLVVALLFVQQLRARPTGSRSAVAPGVALILFSLVGLHMGFLQVGVGLVTIAALSRVHSRDLVEINTAKTAIIAVTALGSTISFWIADRIAWIPAGWLALGAAAGSFAASRWSVRKGHGAIRIAVLAVCVLVFARTVASWFAN